MASSTINDTITKWGNIGDDATRWSYLKSLLQEVEDHIDPLTLRVSTPAADGAADMSCTLFKLGSGIDLTAFTPTRAGQFAIVYCSDSTNNATITCGAGVTLNSTGNNKATFDDAEDALVMVALSTTRWLILVNIGATSLSTV